MKYLLPVVTAAIILSSCGGNDAQQKTEAASSTQQSEQTASGNPSYDPKRGEGKFTHVEVGATLDAAKAEAGDKVYSVKCSSCHKLSDEKLVGPGWKGVSTRHSAEWIMNFITNPDEMLNKDPKAQAMLELCLVRMPNQNLTDEDARNVFEFMRKNDGVK